VVVLRAEFRTHRPLIPSSAEEGSYFEGSEESAFGCGSVALCLRTSVVKVVCFSKPSQFRWCGAARDAL
jgi:hypothetical protein